MTDPSETRMNQWSFVVAEGLKAHYASPDVAEAVISMMKKKGLRFIVEPEQRDEASVDMPGMVLAHRDWWVAEIDGLTLRIPVTDFDAFLRQMRDLKSSKKFIDRGWANVYGWNTCISLSVDQHERLHRMMESQRPMVQSRAQAEKERFDRVISEVNETLNASKAGASIIPMPKHEDPLTDQKGPIGGAWN